MSCQLSLLVEHILYTVDPSCTQASPQCAATYDTLSYCTMMSLSRICTIQHCFRFGGIVPHPQKAAATRFIQGLLLCSGLSSLVPIVFLREGSLPVEGNKMLGAIPLLLCKCMSKQSCVLYCRSSALMCDVGSDGHRSQCKGLSNRWLAVRHQ